METILVSKLKEYGVPIEHVAAADIPDYNILNMAKFLKHNKNFIVIGENYYKKCARMMQLKIQHYCEVALWLSHSELNLNPAIYGNVHKVDVLAIVQLYETSEFHKPIIGGVVNRAIHSRVQVLLGCDNVDKLKLAFPYDLDLLDNEFIVWKEESENECRVF